MIEIQNLNFFYGKNHALSNISTIFYCGKINCLIGPNGSGKSTFFNCISDNLDFEKNCIFYDGLEFTKNIDTIKRKMCFIPDLDKIELNLTGKEYLNFYLDLYEKPSNYPKALFFADLYDLNLDKLASSYSHGMIKKLQLISAFIIDTKYIILDEPFNGLDPEYTVLTQQILQKLAKKNKTIILSTHNLDIVQRIADNLVVLVNGKTIFDGTVSEYLKVHKSKDIFSSWSNIISPKIYENIENYI